VRAARAEADAAKRARLVGKLVVDSEGNEIGTVRDVIECPESYMRVSELFDEAKESTPVGRLMVVETKEGESMKIACDKIQAAGEYVILKPPATPGESPREVLISKEALSEALQETVQEIGRTCPTCGGRLTRTLCFGSLAQSFQGSELEQQT
jgi:sporulation protein YlmC with PRC-barrel domain